jgi:hypothetical protein
MAAGISGAARIGRFSPCLRAPRDAQALPSAVRGPVARFRVASVRFALGRARHAVSCVLSSDDCGSRGGEPPIAFNWVREERHSGALRNNRIEER